MSNLANVKKGDTVILHMFTGLAVNNPTVEKVDKTTITVQTNKGTTVFSKKTGKQIEPECKSEKYANFLTEDDGSYDPEKRTKAKKKAADKKKAAPTPTKEAKVSKKKAVEVEDEDDDEEEEEAPVKKAVVKKKKKVAKKVVEEDDDDYEDADEE